MNDAMAWARWKRPLGSAILCGALAASLSGCFGVLVGGAVMGGVAASDRRTLGAQTEDKGIALKGESRIPAVAGPDSHVNVTSYNRRVLLTGEVTSEAYKAAAEREAKAIENVDSVANELEVSGPSSYTSRSSDTIITTQVKTALVDMKTIYAASFKIVTERGTVYMLGRVTEREGQVGADVARGVSGVQRVVKMFDYISEEEMRTLQPQRQEKVAL